MPALAHTFDTLSTLEVFPIPELVFRDKELQGNLVCRDQNITQNARRTLIVFNNISGQNLKVLHNARGFEGRDFETQTERFRVLRRLRKKLDPRRLLNRLDGKGALHDATPQAVRKIPGLVRFLSIDIYALAALGRAILGTIHNTPLNRETKRIQARQDNRKITSTLRRRAFQQAIDILQQTIFHRGLQT